MLNSQKDPEREVNGDRLDRDLIKVRYIHTVDSKLSPQLFSPLDSIVKMSC